MRTIKHPYLCLIAALAPAFPAGGATVTPPDPGPGLFTPLPESRLAAPLGRAVLRQRPVSVDFARLEALRAEGGSVRLNLFDDAAFTGRVVKVERHGGAAWSVSGRLAEEPLGEFVLVRNKDVLVATVWNPSRHQVFEVRFTPEGVHSVRQVEESGLGACGNAEVPSAAIRPAGDGSLGTGPSSGGSGSGPSAGDGGGSGSSGDASCGDDGALAVVVFYTNVARAAAGGKDAMEAEVIQAVTTSNDTYSNSGVNLRMRLARMEEIAYNEAGTFQDHLDRLESTTDTIMDNVHNVRSLYGGDVVALIVEDDDSDQPQSLCGKAGTMDTLSHNFRTEAFSITNRGCATSNFSFVHEVGHNLGADHDDANADATRLYTYARGWLFQGTSAGNPRYRTVMAYNGSPSSSRIGRWSNPDISFDGTATGVAVGQANEAHNALTLNNSLLTGTNWNRNTMWVQFGYGGSEVGCPAQPFNTFGEGVNAVPWTGTVMVRAGVTNERMTINKPMTLNASGGPAIIGKL